VAKRGRVVVVGSTNTDLVVHTDRLPGPGETVLGGDLLTFAGGKGANQAVAAARAGADAIFIGAFGDDDFGRARRADLEREGVDCSRCVTKKGVPSGVALIAIGEGRRGAKSENLILVAPGANARLTPADVKRGMPSLTGDDVVLCSLEVPIKTVQAALSIVPKDGRAAKRILNPAPFPQQGLPRRLLECRPILTPNETEFELLLGTAPGTREAHARVRALLRRGIPAVLVTQGARGVLHYHEYLSVRAGTSNRPPATPTDIERRLRVGCDHVPAPKVKPIDTVGAGDCFNGSLAAHFAGHRWDYVGAIRFAVTAAAIKVTRHGAQAGMPRRAEVLRMMKRGSR
jgi:ribokinase